MATFILMLVDQHYPPDNNVNTLWLHLYRELIFVVLRIKSYECEVSAVNLASFLGTRYSPNHKISGELKSCNSFWIYLPLWTTLFVAMYHSTENTSVYVCSANTGDRNEIYEFPIVDSIVSTSPTAVNLASFLCTDIRNTNSHVFNFLLTRSPKFLWRLLLIKGKWTHWHPQFLIVYSVQMLSFFLKFWYR